MLRAHARTDSRLSTYNSAEAVPSRELLAAAYARPHAHAPQIPFVLSKPAARRRELFSSQSRPASRARAVASLSRRSLTDTVVVRGCPVRRPEVNHV
jgi:hypothetical protein